MKKIYKPIQLFIVCLCFFLIIRQILIDDTNINFFSSHNFHLIIVGIIFTIILVFLYGSLIYKILISCNKLKLKIKSWFFIFFNSQFLDAIPFTGFIYKALKLKKVGLSYKNFFFTYSFIFFVWMISSSILFLIQLIFLSIFLNEIKIFYYALFIFSLNLILIFLFKISKITIKNFLKIYLMNKLYKIITYIDSNLKLDNIIIFIKYAFFIQILELTLYIIAVNYFNYEIELINIYEIFLIISIIGFFPITPKNIGISELVAGLLLYYHGLNFTDGVILQIFVRIIYLISISILFFINNLLITNKKNSLNLKKNDT